jgi:hypothetical protein
MSVEDFPRYVRDELVYSEKTSRGDRKYQVRRVQEWLTFNGFAVLIDQDFGPATEAAVKAFQENADLPITGVADESTWAKLVAPLRRALEPVNISNNQSLSEIVRVVANQHLAEHPIELGGENRGPWVRVYVGGNDGTDWKWCAGFVSFILRQACQLANRDMPIKGSVSCDTLASQAMQNNLFVPGKSLSNGNWADLGDMQIFLVRRTSSDWTHTGFSFGGNGETFLTIEGNGDEHGGAGHEVCSRRRGIEDKDFIFIKG